MGEQVLFRNAPEFADLKRTGFGANEVLTSLYADCLKWGEVIREIHPEGRGFYVLDWEVSDPHRSDVCSLMYRGAIVRIDGSHDCIFLHGTPVQRPEMARGADEILMFGRMNWNEVLKDTSPMPGLKDLSWPEGLKALGINGLPPKEEVGALTDSQMERILSHSGSSTLSRAQLVFYSKARDQVGTRDDYLSNSVYDDRFVAKEKPTSRYGNEIVPHLAEYVCGRLGIPY